MSSNVFDLSTVNFTNGNDVVAPGKTIFNPAASTVKTLRGNDQIIGTSSVKFDLKATAETAAQDIGQGTNPSSSAVFINQGYLDISGIINQGDLHTNRGRDVVRGRAVAVVSAETSTMTKAIAIANTVDVSAIASSIAIVDIAAIANGIKNTGELGTGAGSDTVDGEVIGSVSAEARAELNVEAIATVFAQEPVTGGLQAVAQGLAISLATAKVVATGINNQQGEMKMGWGGDKITAKATSFSTARADVEAAVLAAATPENRALVQGVFDAVANVEDKAIAFDNSNGFVGMGLGRDILEANATASDTAIAIKNDGGVIRTGDGGDKITAYATGNKSYGIFGGDIITGYGKDEVRASSFGGNVNIRMGRGGDFVEGFGDAKVDGGAGFDTISFGSYSKSDFTISYGSSGSIMFERGGVTMTTNRFEQFDFADGSYNAANL
ncbi:MAG: hypothetical protein QNJ51_08100 [Calothrix sp. MO_167.B12]|nr:hypothetical protein [Calothrix sp. MO_167.B12]